VGGLTCEAESPAEPGDLVPAEQGLNDEQERDETQEQHGRDKGAPIDDIRGL
jgi:hypothetical protein